MPTLLSILVSTYNWPQALAVVLESLRRQTDHHFEVVVADDGSGAETAALIRRFQADFPVPLKHAWQTDQGYRLAASRNRALEQTSGDYLVIMDGDCFVLPDFVAVHRQLAEPGWFVSGKRSYLRSGLSRRILDGVTPFGLTSRPVWLGRSLCNQCTRPAEFIRFGDGAWRKKQPAAWQKVQTCNLGVWRSDCLTVNGFDERYVGHGLEDSDFVLRLLRSGARRKLGNHASLVLHLNHERRDRPPESKNAELFAALEAGVGFRAGIGLDENAPGHQGG
ncbi:MAG: glycosyltransferase family 2 protein [Rhodospirillaceae bacterium]